MSKINFRNILISVCLLSNFLFSCNTGQTENGVTLNLEDVIQNSKEVQLSEIVESIEYVKLETNKEALLKNSWGGYVLAIDGYFLISQRARPLLVFDNTGKFIRSIGSIGRGPGEYYSDYKFAYNKANKKIYILNVTKRAIHCFNLQGNYINDIKLKESVITFEYIGNNLFCGCLRNIINDESSSYNYIIFDDEGKIQNKHYIPGEATSRSPGPKPGTFFAREKPPIYINSPSGVNILTSQNDSIFTISDDGSMSIRFTWNLGKYDSEYDFLDHASEKPDNDKYINTYLPIEGEKYWFIYFNRENKPHRALYNKQNNDYYEITPLGKKLTNDIDGGPSFWPNFNSSAGKTFVSLLDPLRLMKSLDNGEFESVNIKHPEKNKKFIELVKSLNENDNPIIMLTKLK